VLAARQNQAPTEELGSNPGIMISPFFVDIVYSLSNLFFECQDLFAAGVEIGFVGDEQSSFSESDGSRHSLPDL
jgi:hypothetical protein